MVSPHDDESTCVRTDSVTTELMALVPQLAAYFRRARDEMPPEMLDDFRAYGLGPRHGAVLTQLLTQPCSVGELAARLGVSLPTISEVVSDLVASGWIHRRADPGNRRRALLSLDPQRRAVLSRFAAIRVAPVRRTVDRLTASERAGFMAGLRAWVQEANTGQVPETAE
jgi:DNA-binding MarR family transcriptional regulator